MLTYTRLLRSSNRTVESLTGMTKKAFKELLPSYQKAEKDHPWNKIQGRQRDIGGGDKPALYHSQDRLLFIVIYFKLYPTQDLQGILFGLSQPWANKWIHRLSPLLEKALGYKKALPLRKTRSFDDMYKVCPDVQMIIDGTERPILRPKDSDKQKNYYSGKKKRHTMKNTVVISERTKKILLLGQTSPGKIHDKKLLDVDPIHIPVGAQLYLDSGYQGVDIPCVNILRPTKKPRGGELTVEQKMRNQEIASVRVRAEHSIGGMKHFRIIKDVFRNRKKDFDDKAILIASGLYNHRVESRLQMVA